MLLLQGTGLGPPGLGLFLGHPDSGREVWSCEPSHLLPCPRPPPPPHCLSFPLDCSVVHSLQEVPLPPPLLQSTRSQRLPSTTRPAFQVSRRPNSVIDTSYPVYTRKISSSRISDLTYGALLNTRQLLPTKLGFEKVRDVYMRS